MRIDRQAEITKLKIVFRNFSKAPKSKQEHKLHTHTRAHIYIYVYIYIYTHTHTHTHTHIHLLSDFTPQALFFMAVRTIVGQDLFFYRGFAITLRHTTLNRNPLNEWSERIRDLYLTTNNPHKRQTSMSPAGFEPAIQQASGCSPCGHWDLPSSLYISCGE